MDLKTSIVKEQWNYGDILISNDGKSFVVYNHDNVEEYHGFETMCYVCDNFFSPITVADKDSYRFATSDEIKQFHKLLHRHHKDWDISKKHLIDWKFKPELNSKFYYIDIDGNVKIAIHDDYKDNIIFNFGNCFETKEEAEKMARKIKELLKSGA